MMPALAAGVGPPPPARRHAAGRASPARSHPAASATHTGRPSARGGSRGATGATYRHYGESKSSHSGCPVWDTFLGGPQAWRSAHRGRSRPIPGQSGRSDMVFEVPYRQWSSSLMGNRKLFKHHLAISFAISHPMGSSNNGVIEHLRRPRATATSTPGRESCHLRLSSWRIWPWTRFSPRHADVHAAVVLGTLDRSVVAALRTRGLRWGLGSSTAHDHPLAVVDGGSHPEALLPVLCRPGVPLRRCALAGVGLYPSSRRAAGACRGPHRPRV